MDRSQRKTPKLNRKSSRKNTRRGRLNETGQMSIFIAIIFQVLFVFFAMVINIGLVVHDKINLQNAVDLGAYYAAQRQAEILNEIAHLNYQIRQDWKLLAWRYRVVGTLGLTGVAVNPPESTWPPALKSSGGPLADQAWDYPSYMNEGDKLPIACVAHEMWREMNRTANNENWCRIPMFSPVPPIPSVVNIAGSIVPEVNPTEQFTEQARQFQTKSCTTIGPMNFAWLMQVLSSYRQSIGAKKALIAALRRNLVSSDMRDLRNESVREGVIKTIRKNLSRANQDSFEEQSVQIMNGLAEQNCSLNDGEMALPEIRTAPIMYYRYCVDDPNRQRDFRAQIHTDYSALDQAELAKYGDPGKFRLVADEPNERDPMHSTLGYEKNPWCMAYIGVKAKTSPQKPFAPFGEAIEIEARAFAQPFGGRIGPWFRSRWPRGSANSSGGDRVDPLSGPRLGAGGGLDMNNPNDRLPNYSRFPGDALGLKSAMTWGAQHSIFTSYKDRNPNERLSVEWYANANNALTTGDPLASDGTNRDFNGPAGPLRLAEMSAVLPDLFDATYYSIDPDYYTAYVREIGNADRFQGAPTVAGRRPVPMTDIGGSIAGASGGFGSNSQPFNIVQQIETGLTRGISADLNQKLYYLIRKWEHLLTSWAPHRAQTFTFPDQRFGKCEHISTRQAPIPGYCAQGGRVGYSVRLISRSHLLSQSWNVGGEGESPGPIMNPPSTEF